MCRPLKREKEVGKEQWQFAPRRDECTSEIGRIPLLLQAQTEYVCGASSNRIALVEGECRAVGDSGKGADDEADGRICRCICSCAVTAFGQQGEIPLPPPATETIAPDIPGVVKGGTKVQVIVDGLKHTDGPAAMVRVQRSSRCLQIPSNGSTASH